ncbi:MAG: VOC family protein [Rhodanobacteraceae bacterium]|jgi:uncharacterized glyoxalase superfamily protein PhnB|nr:VOC family protein [Rhodanobacteraceae bacterium]MBP6077433.1 VOC family protein [Xanthomonadales bacterium]
MRANLPVSESSIIPALRYRNAPAMIDWLCRAFGFEKHAVYEDGEGGIAHAQLRYGGGMLMLGSARDDAYGRRMAAPSEIGGRNTQALCVIVTDADAHLAQALAAGAEIVDPISDQDYGGRGYGCRDPEGHLWWFGTYNPWAAALS